ncbi:RNA-directed DNA polymerase, eukaryota, reverse transcriptase zinc-binding domain protein [Tanacetum coccineum]
MKVSTSFYVMNMPPALTSKGLWTVCAPYGRLVDAFIANKLSKGGKRFGFIRFLGVNDANVFVKSLSNIWIGSYHIFITPAINQRSKLITNPKPQPTKLLQYPNNLSNQNTFPILSTNVTKNATPETKSEHQKPSINPTPTNPKCIIALNDQDLINVVNTDSILLVKLKDIDSMSNMYTICRNEGFSDLNIHHVGGYWIWIQFPSSTACSKFQGNESLKRLYSVKKVPSSNFMIDERIFWIEISGLPLCAWGSNAYKKIACNFGKFLFVNKEDSSALSSGRVCISSKSHHLISENVQELDISSESIDDYTVDDLEHIQANLNNIDNQDFDQKMDLNEDNKQGEAVIQQPPKEEVDSKVSNPDRKAEPSDLSRPPGFEFMKKSSSSSSKCSTSFSRFRKKDIKGVSLIHELNQIIDVGSSLGYDVRGCKRSLNKMINGIEIHMDMVGSQPYPPSCQKINFGPSLFKLYNSWLLRDGFDDLIKSEWELLDSNNTGFPIKCHDKFRILKSKIRQWNNNNKSLDTNRKTAAIEELSSIEKKIDAGSATHSDIENRLKLLHELEDIDKFASMDLIQKSRVKWDIEGDENSKFFHGLINQKRRNQMINEIMVEGIWITDPILIKDAFSQFYKYKFQAQDSQVLFPNLPHSHTLNTVGSIFLNETLIYCQLCGI